MRDVSGHLAGAGHSAFRLFSISSAFVLCSFAANGQTSLPGPADPGQVPRRFDQSPVPLSQERPVVRPPSAPIAPPGETASLRFVLKGIVVEGATVFEPSDFEPLFAPLIGQDVSLETLLAIAESVSQQYRQAGYILSQAVVPPQTIRDGVATIRVIEGYIKNIAIDGEVKGRSNILGDFALKISNQKPINIKELERYILLMDDLPGVAVRAVIEPSDTTGAANLILVLEHETADGVVGVDNRGTRYLGPIQSVAQVNLNSVLGWYEKTTLRGIVTGQPNELKFFDAGQEHVVTDEGTRLRGSVGRSAANPGYRLKGDDISSIATSLGLEITHPVIRSRSENLFAQGTFSVRNVSTDLSGGAQRLSDDRIRSVGARLSYDFIDTALAPAINQITVNASQGLNVLGARESGSADLSRPAGRSDFTKFGAEAQRIQSIGGPFRLVLGAAGQYALSPLLASEEFAFGGAGFGRGYDPAELTGDHGLAGKLELQFSPSLETDQHGYQIYGFYDAGLLWNIDGESASRRQSAASAGGGIRFKLASAVSANFEIGVPLTAPVAAEGETKNAPRLFFSISARF